MRIILPCLARPKLPLHLHQAAAAHVSSIPNRLPLRRIKDASAAAIDRPPSRSAHAAAGTAHYNNTGALLLFLVFAFGLVSLQYCFSALDREGRRRRQQQQGAAPASGRRGGSGMATRRARSRGGGVDPELLRSLPVTVYRAAAAPGSKEECAVCLAELEDGEAARFLPRCGHGFHAQCVDTWLASHTTCPLCRLTVIAKPDAPPCPAAMLPPPVPPEPAHYAATLPAGVLLGVSASTGATAVLVIEIPELAVPTTTAGALRDGAKSPGSARLTSSFWRLWSFGRQGAGASSSCSCAGAGDGADVEQGGHRPAGEQHQIPELSAVVHMHIQI